MSISFSNSGFLLLLFVAPPVVAGLWYFSYRMHLLGRAQYGEPQLLDRLSKRTTLRRQAATLIAWLSIAVLLSVAAAGPIATGAPDKVKAGNVQVIVAFDVSQSMGAEDYRDTIPASVRNQFIGEHGNRLDEAKYMVMSQIMPNIANNQLGFVTYKGDGFAQAELTDDFQALAFVLSNWVTIGNAPGGGSDYARGLQTAINMFKRDGNAKTEKVIVLFSDGGFTGSGAMLAKVEHELNALHIRLIVLGLGLPQPAMIPQYDENNQPLRCDYGSCVLEVNGKKVTTTIEPGPLKQLAQATGGRYIHVDTSGHLGINWPTAVAGKSKTVSNQSPVYRYPLFCALLILSLLGFKGIGKDALVSVYKRRR